MSKAATSSFHTVTRTASCTSLSDTCSASMPGARSVMPSTLSVGWISAMRGTSRCVMNCPCASTTIQARSNSKPVSISSASSTAMPPQLLIGCTYNSAIRTATSAVATLVMSEILCCCMGRAARVDCAFAPALAASRPAIASGYLQSSR